MSPIPDSLSTALADRYRIERELGHGGMATVYLAHDLKHDRQVAIKVLRPELAAVLGTERFLAEIKVTARIDHPHILTLIDSGSAAGFLYYVLPLVRGESLRDKLKREKQLGLDEALAITKQIAGALDYAHRQGVIHRDIKPENILLQDGEAMLTDFGIALAIQGAAGARLTETGLAVGTQLYMSPEQSMAERTLDGRSDQYSLACVLYEMLAGEPPYTGSTGQAVIAKRMIQPVPSVRTLRETVPEAVDRALISALAKYPADRFATAGAFAGALTDPVRFPIPSGVQGSRVSVRRWLGPTAALMLAVIVALVWHPWSRQPSTLDPNLLAIAPFEVHDPSLQLWHEGLVDVLARNLDGAGPLRTVPTSVVLHRWRGPADRATAAVLGRETGAGLVAFGDLAVRGADSIVLRLTLLDVGRNTIDGEVQVAGPTDRINDLADSLGRSMLGALGHERPIAAVRQGSLGSTSLPAVKAFLQGEQWYRRGVWDSALVYYDEAIADDSTFSLALRRMWLVLGWGPSTSGRYKLGDEYWQQAVRHRVGQSTRDSIIMTASLLDNIGDTSTNPARLVDFHSQSITTIREAVRRYPADPEAWYQLGEDLYHFPPQIGGTAAEALAAFDHSIELDSGFVPAYEHTPLLAMRVDGVELARRYLNAYVRLNPTETKYSSDLRLQAALFDLQKDTAGLNRLLDSIPNKRLGQLIPIAMWWPDSAETGIRVSRLGVRRDQGRDHVFHLQLLASNLASRGHLREAWRLYEDSVTPEHVELPANPFPELALLGVVPPDTAARIFGRVLDAKASWPPEWQFIGLAWWSQQRDTASLKRVIVRANLEATRDTSLFDSATNHYLAASANAYLALARRDSAAALAAFQALPESPCAGMFPPTCLFQKFTQAGLEAAAGKDRPAAATIDRWVADNWLRLAATPVIVLARLERAQLAERLGERALALQYYQFVADVWRNADPTLSPYVKEARAGLQRLTREPRP